MNIDRGIRYCHGLRVAPDSDGEGVQGDRCRICGRFYPFLVIRPPTVACLTCGASVAGSDYCALHNAPSKRARYERGQARDRARELERSA